MSPELILENLLRYGLHSCVLVLGVVSALRWWKIPDPRWRLRIAQAALLACLLLPWLAPWQRETIVVATQARSAAGPIIDVNARPAARSIDPALAVLALLAAGSVLRLAWLCAGLLRLRRYRKDARWLDPLPQPLRWAAVETGACAPAGVVTGLRSPVMFGFQRPVVLLPETFTSLPEGAQQAIACHEYLHVKRGDWLASLIEETIAALLWFHPAIWLLLSVLRLAREESVDAEVVRLTNGREAYVQALLDLSGAAPSADLAPAPGFMGRRQLVERVRSLTTMESPVSKLRLVVSTAVALLVAVGSTTLVFRGLPLRAEPQIQEESVQTELRVQHRTPVKYPIEAKQKRIDGQVVLEATVAPDGTVIDARVISGPDELRRAAQESVLGWHFVNDSRARLTTQVTVNFKLLPDASTGGVAGSALGGVTPFAAPSAGPGGRAPSPGSRLDQILYMDVPADLRQALEARLSSYTGRPMSDSLMDDVRTAAFELDRHLSLTWMAQGDRHLLAISLQPPRADPPATPSSPPDFPPSPTGEQRVRIGGNVASAKLIHKVNPEYPALAKQARIQGTVRFNILIAADGSIKSMQLVSGHPLLVPAAQEAVRQWTFQKTLLNGSPVEVVTTVDINFTLLE